MDTSLIVAQFRPVNEGLNNFLLVEFLVFLKFSMEALVFFFLKPTYRPFYSKIISLCYIKF